MAYTVIWFGVDGVKGTATFRGRAYAEKHATKAFLARQRDDGVVLVEVHDKEGNVTLRYGGYRAPRSKGRKAPC
jgi:hypothetical protein